VFEVQILTTLDIHSISIQLNNVYILYNVPIPHV